MGPWGLPAGARWTGDFQTHGAAGLQVFTGLRPGGRASPGSYTTPSPTSLSPCLPPFLPARLLSFRCALPALSDSEASLPACSFHSSQGLAHTEQHSRTRGTQDA